MSMAKKLQRLKKHIVREEPPALKKEEPPEGIRYWDVWKAEGAEVFELDGEYCLTRETHYDIDTVHGKYTFKDAQKIIRQWSDFNGSNGSEWNGQRDLPAWNRQDLGRPGNGEAIFFAVSGQRNSTLRKISAGDRLFNPCDV